MQLYGAGLLWCALTLSWPVFQSLGSDLVQGAAWPRRMERLHLSTWIGSVGLPYLALLSGAVSVRDYGLVLAGVSSWIPRVLVSLLLGLALALALFSMHFPGGESSLQILEEPRWALYRALAWAWGGSLGLALVAAVAAAVLERILERVIRGGRLRATSHDRGWLCRVIYSNLVFGLTFSFWMVLLGRVGSEILQRAVVYRQAANARRNRPKS